MTLDFPVIFLLSTHLGSEELQQLEDQIPTLTYDINEAEVVLGKVFRKERALFELRRLKLDTTEVAPAERSPTPSPRPSKRIRLSTPALSVLGSSDIESDTCSEGEIQRRLIGPKKPVDPTVKVVKLAWFTKSIEAGEVLPMTEYIVYEGRKIPKEKPKPRPEPEDIMRRALADASSSPSRPRSSYGHSGNSHKRTTYDTHPVVPSKRPPPLLHQTTSEHDIDEHLPPIPAYLHTTYSCQRPSPIHPPNEAFIEELLKIRTARTLMGDKIGVRAYSSAIATVTAYPYEIQTPSEVARLPGCGAKIAGLFQEFKETGFLFEAREDETDPKLAVLKQFYEIWGVGEGTAREFYNKGWRDLDDIIEHGWNSLIRVQQIGVKYYDEFLIKIPRKEVEQISEVILAHANKIRKGFEMVIVGGYRRGKKESGDVDVILSHRDEEATAGFVERIVISLENDKYITHTLSLTTKNTERGQVPVAWKGSMSKVPGTGFDTLDKALVVWQEPGNKKNLHRRVDIIISPWKTAGCAVLGWTSGTTFQRDLRRYCKKEKNLKFDSSGVRSRVDGSWVDLESDGKGNPAPDMLTAERRIFDKLGLEWRPPEERCTN
ncbi:hypothetical protein QBC35DRAFT_486730 [Podospora australis]|uniref:DNA polymerase n=1 Tax=Podospora australis TaxID=1536484 RepID=A0AAN6X090_9PEZI|nr:hypothetical protein QBC35DRAFT_486730 [Podospora australis]